jgi:hypothetical protein
MFRLLFEKLEQTLIDEYRLRFPDYIEEKKRNYSE